MNDSKLGHRGYIASRPIKGNHIPHHIQNLVIRDYASRRGLQYLLSATEMSPDNCFIVLNDVMDSLDDLGGIIMYSLFMLPADHDQRFPIYERFLETGKSLHAAVENISINNKCDIQRIEEIFVLTGVLQRCPPSIVLKEWLN